MELQKIHIDIMEHTISGAGRNWFGTSYGCRDSDAFEELVKAGLATKEVPPGWMGDDVIYRLTPEGKAALQRPESAASKPHAESCIYCSQRWYHEHDIGEVVNIGSEGHVCDGHKNPGVGNLKSFPFKTKQKCFVAKN